MKANELRIGNFIIYSDIKKVFDVGLWFFSELDARISFINDFEPIPLTKEWLIRFGFKEDELFSGQMIANGLSYSPRYYKNGIQISVQFDCFDKSNKFRLLHYCTNIEFIHQLQNLYHALTGEELKLKQE